MNSFSIADELDQAVNNVLTGIETAGVNTDLEIGELMRIASELRDLPKPAFKAQLKAQLTGHPVTEAVALGIHQIRAAQREEEIPAILPSLFRSTSDGYPLHQRSMAASLFMHVGALTLMVVAGVFAAHRPDIKTTVTAHMISLADYPLPPSEDVSRGGGGGGTHDKLKVSQGVPPRFAAEQLTPPLVVVQNLHPVLPTEPTVIGPPEVVFPKAQMGDLYSKLNIPSNGVGYGGGIGDTHGTGDGNGDGSGVGPGFIAGIGGGPYSVGRGVSAPRPIYDPEPEYSNEARVAKFQGDVVLLVVVGADGIPRNIRVQRSVGMGLDEKAIAAVSSWRFAPGMKDGQPVPVRVSIEVNFRLF